MHRLLLEGISGHNAKYIKSNDEDGLISQEEGGAYVTKRQSIMPELCPHRG